VAAAAEAFTRDVMATARAHPREVVAMEKILETLVETSLASGRVVQVAGIKARVGSAYGFCA
jgi:hypothetical protein